MAIMQCIFESEVLGKKSGMTVLLPEQGASDCSVLYLLHGHGDHYLTWCNQTEIEALAREYNLAVIMPEAEKSFYCNMVRGNRYYDHVAEELPALAERMFGVKRSPERTHIAGVSMGGYGPFMIALRNPNRFCTAGSFSGCLDLYTCLCRYETQITECRAVFDDFETIPGSNADLFTLIETVKKPPQLYAFCGTEDFLYEDNLRFLKRAQELGIPLQYLECSGGHEWSLWREQIKNYLPWMLAKEK